MKITGTSVSCISKSIANSTRALSETFCAHQLLFASVDSVYFPPFHCWVCSVPGFNSNQQEREIKSWGHWICTKEVRECQLEKGLACINWFVPWGHLPWQDYRCMLGCLCASLYMWGFVFLSVWLDLCVCVCSRVHLASRTGDKTHTRLRTEGS